MGPCFRTEPPFRYSQDSCSWRVSQLTCIAKPSLNVPKIRQSQWRTQDPAVSAPCEWNNLCSQHVSSQGVRFIVPQRHLPEQTLLEIPEAQSEVVHERSQGQGGIRNRV